MGQFVSPAIIGLGLIFNTASIALMLRRSMRTKVMSVYFIALGTADFMFLLFNLAFGPIGEKINITLIKFSRETCAVGLFLLDFSHMFPSTILSLIAITRVLVVFRPLQISSWNNISRSRCLIIMLTATIALINSYNLWAADLVDIGGGFLFCSVIKEYPFFATRIHMWAMSALSSYIPLAILIICNTALVLKIKILRRKREKMVHSPQNEQAEASFTRTAVAVCLVFAVLTVTMTLLGMLSTLMPEEAMWTCREAAVVLGLLSHSINFFLYICASKELRKEINVILHCVACRKMPNFDNSRISSQNSKRTLQSSL